MGHNLKPRIESVEMTDWIWGFSFLPDFRFNLE